LAFNPFKTVDYQICHVEGNYVEADARSGDKILHFWRRVDLRKK
jgi:hypothetical protein